MRHTLLPWALLAIALVAGGLAWMTGIPSGHDEAASEEEPPLARYMADLQRWTHKTALAAEARNARLVDFYHHEMEETVETIQEEAPMYEGHAVGPLTKKMLAPTVEALGTAIDKEAWSAIDKRVQNLARSCNQCHTATGYGFLEVDLTQLSNPYAQDFSPSR